MPNDAYEYMKMLLNVSKNAKIVIECELHTNVRFLALLRAIGRQFTQMNAYFLVMNSKRRILSALGNFAALNFHLVFRRLLKERLGF